MNVIEYLESLGFVGFDVDFPSETVGEGVGVKDVFVNFERKTVVKWASGYDAVTIIGEGLTKDEEAQLFEIDNKR